MFLVFVAVHTGENNVSPRQPFPWIFHNPTFLTCFLSQVFFLCFKTLDFLILLLYCIFLTLLRFSEAIICSWDTMRYSNIHI